MCGTVRTIISRLLYSYLWCCEDYFLGYYIVFCGTVSVGTIHSRLLNSYLRYCDCEDYSCYNTALCRNVSNTIVIDSIAVFSGTVSRISLQHCSLVS